MTTAGGCLCGGVRFTIEGPLAAIQICHCSQCRKAQGGPFATNIPVAAGALRFVQGRELLQEFESSPGKFRVFCRRCGSPMLSRRTALPDVLRVRAGTLDEPVPAVIGARLHGESAAGWWPADPAVD
ncbi:MAG: GFA family protein [Nevskia sp.]